MSAQQVKIIAQVPGTLADLPISENTAVKRGEVIAKITAPDIGARVARVRAERKRAEKERDFACTMVVTDRALAKSGDLSGFNLDKSKKNCDSATLAVSAAKFVEKEAGVAKARSKERAPFDGRILKYLVDEGQSVGPGMAIMQFASQSQQLRLKVPVADLTEIKEGSRVSSELGDGVITDIGAQAMGPGRLVELLVEIKSPKIIRPGTDVKVTLVTKSLSNVSIIPINALGEDSEGYYVVVIEEGRQRRLAVKPGIRSNARVSISPSLKKDTKVVNGGLSALNLDLPVLEVTQ